MNANPHRDGGHQGVSLAQIADHCGAELRGDPKRLLTACAPLQRATPEQLGFLHNPRYRSQLQDTQAGAVILSEEVSELCPVDMLISDNPYACYARAAQLFMASTAGPGGVHARAAVDDAAELGDGTQVAANAVIEAEVRIGRDCVIGAGAVIQAGARIGDGCQIGPNAVIYGCVRIGDRSLVHAGAVIGGDGFGLAMDAGQWLKVPQLGGVRIGADCEIGCNTTIDRGALDDTVLEDDVRLDNQIQIAHNVRIGAHSAMAGCSAVAGSTTLGRYCLVGGGAGILGHLSIADRVTITSMSLVTHSIREPGEYSSGTPLDENRRWRRNAARFKSLDRLARRVMALEKDNK